MLRHHARVTFSPALISADVAFDAWSWRVTPLRASDAAVSLTPTVCRRRHTLMPPLRYAAPYAVFALFITRYAFAMPILRCCADAVSHASLARTAISMLLMMIFSPC